MPLKIDTSNKISYSELNDAFQLLMSIVTMMKEDTTFSKLPGNNLDNKNILPQNALFVNAMYLSHLRNMDKFTFTTKKFFVDELNSDVSLSKLHELDIEKAPHSRNRVVRFTKNSNLTTQEYMDLDSIMYLMSKSAISISIDDILSLAKTENIAINATLLDIASMYDGKMIKTFDFGHGHYPKYPMSKGCETLINEFHDNFLKKNNNTNNNFRMTSKRIRECNELIISFINFVSIYKYINTHIPKLLKKEVWKKGYF